MPETVAAVERFKGTLVDLVVDELGRGGPASGLVLRERLLRRRDVGGLQRVALFLLGPPYGLLRTMADDGQLRRIVLEGGSFPLVIYDLVQAELAALDLSKTDD